MNESEFFKPVSMYAIMAWRFLVWYFFGCCSELIDVYFRFRFIFEFWLFFYVANPFDFSIFSSFPYFAPKFYIVCFTCVAFCFSSQYVPAFFLCFIICACCRFLICISSRISYSGFEFLFMFFGEHYFFHRLISLLHRLFRLIQWYFSLGYVLIILLFFHFLPWLFSRLDFLAMVILSPCQI